MEVRYWACARAAKKKMQAKVKPVRSAEEEVERLMAASRWLETSIR
jgi:hypothetical protein